VPTHAVKTNSTDAVALLPNGARRAERVRVYNPNSTGTATGTLTFYHGSVAYPAGAFSVDAKQTALLELGLDLHEGQSVELALDSAPTTQLSCFTTYF
jgi:hypothetical protein